MLAPLNRGNFPPDKGRPIPCNKVPLVELEGVLFDPHTLKAVPGKMSDFWRYRDDFAELEKHEIETFSWNLKEDRETMLEIEQPVGRPLGFHDTDLNMFSSGITKVSDWFVELWDNFKRISSVLIILALLGVLIIFCKWCKCYRVLCKLGNKCRTNQPEHEDIELRAR